jgi:hypothetical protein
VVEDLGIVVRLDGCGSTDTAMKIADSEAALA